MKRFSTRAATSETLVDRLQAAVGKEVRLANLEKLERVAAAGRTIEALRRRGLLRKQEFHSPTSAELEQLYLTRG